MTDLQIVRQTRATCDGSPDVSCGVDRNRKEGAGTARPGSETSGLAQKGTYGKYLREAARSGGLTRYRPVGYQRIHELGGIMLGKKLLVVADFYITKAQYSQELLE
jgi:hypothetical protein